MVSWVGLNIYISNISFELYVSCHNTILLVYPTMWKASLFMFLCKLIEYIFVQHFVYRLPLLVSLWSKLGRGTLTKHTISSQQRVLNAYWTNCTFAHTKFMWIYAGKVTYCTASIVRNIGNLQAVRSFQNSVKTENRPNITENLNLSHCAYTGAMMLKLKA